MTDKNVIQTTKQIYPQIYAYITPDYPRNDGWVKIGYTDQKDVHVRINQQTQTAGIYYDLLWSAPAKFSPHPDVNDWFTDKQFHSYLRIFKHVKQRLPHEWFFYDNKPEQSHQDFTDFLAHRHDQASQQLDYELRDEQQQAIQQTLAYAQETPEGEFLWNAKPRFGKTLTTYDLVRQLDAHKVLIVTNRPAIANSWFDDFQKFIAWQTDYAFVSESDALKQRPVLTREQFLNQRANGRKRMIMFMSLQDLKGSVYFGGTHVKHDWLIHDQTVTTAEENAWLRETPWDLLVIDEAHEGVETFKTDVAFDKIQRKFTLHLSGTPFRALASGKFSANEIYNWTYADEQAAKAAWHDPDRQNPYAKLPQLNLFSYQMGQMITDEVNRGANIDGENIDYAFDLNEFFATNDSGKFIHEADVKKWLDTLTHNLKYPFSTDQLRNELKHTFWLLNRVASAKALQKLLNNHPVFGEYAIILAAGDGSRDDSSDTSTHVSDAEQVTSQRALDRVKHAIQQHEKTITLSVGQLTTGITIPEWTAVLMLSNVKSPSLYMQAAFRAQNPWEYQVNGELRQKHNAYVFDFAPERTLTIYEEFANNLSRHTSGGGGTGDERRANIQQLLNFFPVIAEDSAGQMVELDVNQVLTLPKVFKAQEVVRRGFMSNFLFHNISGIFASEKAREILEQLNPVDAGKVVPRKTQAPIDTQGIAVDEHGKATIEYEIVINTNAAQFGEKVYGEIQAVVAETTQNINEMTLSQSDDQSNDQLAQTIATGFINSIQAPAKELAREQGLTQKYAEQVVKQSAQAITREIQAVQKHSQIQQKTAELEYQKVIAEAQFQPPAVAQTMIAQATDEYQVKCEQIVETCKEQVAQTVATQAQALTEQTTHKILQKAEDNKKNKIEDDVRGRLRGFSRTIPSFLMAYGTPETTLANFDTVIKDAVFAEVTGITLEQFRTLRDEFDFFDATVFDQSVQEFLAKRRELANYFDDTQTEDIFDYIPPQETNQIFTPKWVVKMMVDKLEAEDPELFRQSGRTFADLYVKSGLYLAEVVKRLYVGLADEIPDKNARLKHILERQVYGFAPSEIILNIARNFVFGFDDKGRNIDQSHVVLLDTVPYAKGEAAQDFAAKCDELFGMGQGEAKQGQGQMKFDVVLGNPPYQENDNGQREDGAANASASPLYHYYFYLSKKLAKDYISLIFPARWLYGAGKGLGSFSRDLLNDKHFKSVKLYQKSSDVFTGAEIKGGVIYFVYDIKREQKANIEVCNHDGEVSKFKHYLNSANIDIFIPYKELISILNKVKNNINISENNVQSIILPLKPYGLRTDFFKNPSKYHLPPIFEKREKTTI
ncbi:Eco57I restriction-modification methylase domain-containing protein [Faucicola atlantae]|uniref:Eco57I restriction-modification methylase domain-containing protein n=1 Tax=Faucicola atlantae TaxID=34059 RepID=UPI0025B0420C|nr:Eco57I restriction-modification methylase domain-containing protein [Moraxella atlantae]